MPCANCNSCLVKIENLCVSFGSDKILNNVSFNLHCGEMTALIGPNGAGKTTLLRAMLGEVPCKGNISFYPVKSTKATVPKIGYVPQAALFDKSLPISVKDLFSTCGNDLDNIKEKLEVVKAAHLLNKKLGTLSGGELQRVLLAFALFPSIPDLLILDEPTTGMDISGREMFYELLHLLLAEYHTSVLIVSHDFGIVEKHADKVCFLGHGTHLFGTPAEIFSSETFKKTFMFKGL